MEFKFFEVRVRGQIEGLDGLTQEVPQTVQIGGKPFARGQVAIVREDDLTDEMKASPLLEISLAEGKETVAEEPVVEHPVGAEEPKAPAPAKPDYDSFTVEELREKLEKRGLVKSGVKAELIERLEEDDAAKEA